MSRIGGKTIQYDPNVGNTVAEILNRFFKKNPNAIISYICEDSDNKAYKRQISFKSWFQKNSNSVNQLSLLQAEIKNVIYIGAVLSKQNTEKNKIKKYLQVNVVDFQNNGKESSIVEL